MHSLVFLSIFWLAEILKSEMQQFFFKFIIRFILILSAYNMLFTEDTETRSHYNYKHFSSIACIYTGFGFATNSVDFFNDYKIYFNKQIEQFKVTPLIGAALKFNFLEDYRFGLSVDYIGASLKDYFIEKFSRNNVNFTREIGEILSINSIPFIFVAEFKPIEQQFQGYVGVGAGLVYSSIEWNEAVKSDYSDEIRISSEIINEKTVYPAFKIYSGVELGFDKKQGSNFLGSLIIESGYTFIMRYTKIYKNLSEQFTPAPGGWSENYAIFPGYFNLSFGLSFNFQRREKQKNDL